VTSKTVIHVTRETPAHRAADRAWFHDWDDIDDEENELQTSQDLQNMISMNHFRAERFVRTMAGDLLTDDEVRDILRSPETKETDQ
jgi:hypothetical protein